MAKKNPNKSGRQVDPRHAPRKGNSLDAVKVIALLVFILVGLGVVGGTIWYYYQHEPAAAASIEKAAADFTKEFFTVRHDSITGQEGSQWITEKLAQTLADSDRVAAWKNREIVARVEGDVEVSILRQGLRTGTARVIFWQYEEVDDETDNFLQYYDYEFVYSDGSWKIDRILTPNETELEELRLDRGVWEEHYGEDEDDDAEDDQEEDASGEEDTE